MYSIDTIYSGLWIKKFLIFVPGYDDILREFNQRIGNSGAKTMTYREIFDLKYNQGISTSELVKRFPDEVKRISEVALLEVSEDMLRQVISEAGVLQRLIGLKKRYGVG